MRYLRFVLILCGTLLFFYATLKRDSDRQISRQSDRNEIGQIEREIVNQAEASLPQWGILTEQPDGYVYLKVDEGYINQLYPFLDPRIYKKPPYFRRKNSPGAHITVFYAEERRKTGEIREIGRRYDFKISGLKSVPPKTGEYIVLQVASPGLEDLRDKYGLQPLVKGHDFHITIAKRKNRLLGYSE